MSYNRVATDSRSNSPVPFDRSNRGQGYGQQSSRDDTRATHTGLLNRTSTPDQDLPTRPSSTNQQLLWQDSPENRNRYSQNQEYPTHHQPGHPDDTAGHRFSYSSGANPLAAPFAHAMRPHHGAQLTATSSVGSYDARDRSISSHRSSAHNLAVGHDPNYNMIQSDTALEGLAERWHAYQAWWEKQYKEKPFYQLWTKSKWILLLSALLLLSYSGAAFAVSLGYILGHFEYSAVVMEFHHNLIYISLAGSCVGIFSALVGLIGIFRENRIWLSWYNLMLWPVFALYLSVGYIAFRRSKNHLRAHLKDEWVHSYSRDQRLLVQRHLKCCGYQDSTYFGEYDLRCFPMINLPGCQHKYNLYEDKLLTTCWTASFALAPLQLFVMIAALLCSNHVDGMLRSGRPGLKSFKEKKHRE
ncbi:unnamed protein product [Mortierella alpina]